MPEHWDPLAGVEPDDIRLFLVEALSIAVGLPHQIAQPELAKFIDEAAMIVRLDALEGSHRERITGRRIAVVGRVTDELRVEDVGDALINPDRSRWAYLMAVLIN